MRQRPTLRPIRTPEELAEAIADAAARFPGDAEAGVDYLLAYYVMDRVYDGLDRW